MSRCQRPVRQSNVTRGVLAIYGLSLSTFIELYGFDMKQLVQDISDPHDIHTILLIIFALSCVIYGALVVERRSIHDVEMLPLFFLQSQAYLCGAIGGGVPRVVRVHTPHLHAAGVRRGSGNKCANVTFLCPAPKPCPDQAPRAL